MPLNAKRISQLAAYGDLFERLWDCALLLDLESFEILDANPACERVLEWEFGNIKGTSILDWVSEADREHTERSLRIARRRYYPKQFDSRWKKKSVAHHEMALMEVSACVMKLSDGREALQIIAKDVTPIREVQEAAKRYLLELETLNKKLEELSIKDELTQLFNVRHFKRELAKEHERSDRYATPYSIIFVDVDHFKNYNDHNGHPAGDGVLRKVSSIILEQVRNTDLPARYGGEEFVILCAGVAAKNARVLAERLRTAIEKNEFPNGASQPLGFVSVSMGIASFPEDGTQMEIVLENADKALYYSKKMGRNRVTLFSESNPGEKSRKPDPVPAVNYRRKK